MNLCIPYNVIEPVMEDLSSPELVRRVSRTEERRRPAAQIAKSR
jgi:flagellar motor switch protein FliM